MNIPREPRKKASKTLRKKNQEEKPGAKPEDTHLRDLSKAALFNKSQPQVHDIIGTRLREYYDEIAKQPLPDKFVKLLKRLDDKTASKKED